MKKLIIKEINGYEYILKDDGNKEYNLNLEFYELDENLKKGDYIYLNEKLLYNERVYSFGPIKKEVNENIENITDAEIIGVKKGANIIYLQRYYG